MTRVNQGSTDTPREGSGCLHEEASSCRGWGTAGEKAVALPDGPRLPCLRGRLSHGRGQCLVGLGPRLPDLGREALPEESPESPEKGLAERRVGRLFDPVACVPGPELPHGRRDEPLLDEAEHGHVEGRDEHCTLV